MKLKVRRKNVYEIIILVVICFLVTIYATRAITLFSAVKWHIFNDNLIKYKNIKLKIPLRCWVEEIGEKLFIYSIPHKKSNLTFSYMSLQKLYVSKKRLNELHDSIIIETEVNDSAEYVFSKELQINNNIGFCSYYKSNNSKNRYYARITIPEHNIYIFVGYMLESDITFYENLIKKVTFHTVPFGNIK